MRGLEVVTGVRKARAEGAPTQPAGAGPGRLEELLTGGNPRALRDAEVVIDLASRRPARLRELVECVFSGDEVVRMRASDALEKVCRARPGLVQPFVPRLLRDMPRIRQASVQWHLAQILSEVSLGEGERAQAVAILEHNLDTFDDWIVTNLTLEALAVFARTSPDAASRLAARLPGYCESHHKSVASRARKLLAEFGGRPLSGQNGHGPAAPRAQRGQLGV